MSRESEALERVEILEGQLNTLRADFEAFRNSLVLTPVNEPEKQSDTSNRSRWF